MKVLREIISSNSMVLKERKSVVGALNPQSTDIYRQRTMTPHQMMEEINIAYNTNPIFRSAVDTCADFIYGGDITFKSDDKYTEERGNAFIKETKMNRWILQVIRETIKSGNGWVEMDFNPVTGLPIKFYPQADSSRWYINCDSHGDPLKKKRIVQDEFGNWDQVPVDNLDEYYIQRIAPGIKYKHAKWFNLSYYLDQKFRQFRIYGIPINMDKMIHFKLNIGVTGVYGQSYLASAINDNLILQELERSIAILAKYKAVPRKIIQYGDKDNPATGEELDDFIIYLESLQRDEDPLVNKPIKMDDLSFAGQDINLEYMLNHIRKKLIAGVVPEFLTGFGADVNRATAQIELISYILSIYSKRKAFLDTLEETIMIPWLEREGLESGHLEFNELDFETKEEKTGRVMQLWSSNLRTLNDCLDELGYTQIGEEGNVYYTEWQSGMMPDMGMGGQGGFGDFMPDTDMPKIGEVPGGSQLQPKAGGDLWGEQAPKDYSIFSESFEPLFKVTKESKDFPEDPTGLSELIRNTAMGIRNHYKQRLDEVRDISGKKTSERFKEIVTQRDIQQLSILLRLGGEEMQKGVNHSIKQAFEKGIADGGKQIGLIGGVPYRAAAYHNIQKNSWRYIKKNVNLGAGKVEAVLYKGLMGELKGKALEKQIEKTYNFMSWKSEQLAVTELRKAYARGIEHTMEHSPNKRYKWITSRRENVCEYCRPLNGREFMITNLTAPRAPLHPNCNCSMKIVKKAQT